MPQIFKVGGCVRDEILGIDSKDIDFTFVLDNLEQKRRMLISFCKKIFSFQKKVLYLLYQI